MDQFTRNFQDLQVNPDMGLLTERLCVAGLFQKPSESSFSSGMRGTSIKNIFQPKSSVGSIPNVLSATSPEFFPMSTSLQQDGARSQTVMPYPSTGRVKTPQYLDKLKSLINQMPPPRYFRHPVPSLHQELKAKYGAQGIQGTCKNYQSAHHSAGYHFPIHQYSAYDSHGAHSVGHDNTIHQISSRGASSTYSIDYLPPGATHQESANGTSGHDSSGYSSGGRTIPSIPPTVYGGTCYETSPYHSASPQTLLNPVIGYGGTRYHAGSFQSPSYTQTICGASNYPNSTSGRYQNSSYGNAGYSASSTLDGAAHARLGSASAALQFKPCLADLHLTPHSLLGYGSSQFETFSSDSEDCNYYAGEIAQRREPRSFLAREHPLLKDILISKSGITRNLVRIYECYDKYGTAHRTYGDEFKEGNYDLIERLKDMTNVGQHRISSSPFQCLNWWYLFGNTRDWFNLLI